MILYFIDFCLYGKGLIGQRDPVCSHHHCSGRRNDYIKLIRNIIYTNINNNILKASGEGRGCRDAVPAEINTHIHHVVPITMLVSSYVGGLGKVKFG